PLNSAPAAFTELPSVAFDASGLSLPADSPKSVEVTFGGGAVGNPVPTTANLVLTVPSLIPGRPDLVFENAAAFDAPSSTISGSLSLPAATMGRASATLQLIPLSPADQQSPPASFSVTVATSLTETLPTNVLPMSGTLLSALNAPPSATFVARAFLAGTQVSNAPLTASDGTFQLLLAPAAAGSLVTVELTPQSQSGADPWYTSSALDPAMNRTLPPIMLPAYSSPNAFTLTVQDANDPTTPVGGAFVRAQVILGSGSAGTTNFQAAGTTSLPMAHGGGGTVTLSLLPGTFQTPLEYDLTVIPPASSFYATQCFQAVAVQAGGTANAPSSLVAIGLTRRPVLTGTVTDATGRPVANVAITATAGPASTGGCTDTPAVSSSTIADSNGNFSLPLDPGSYRLDYDPPAGASVPRLTETAFTIPATGVVQLTHDVALPVAALVRGTVLGPDGAPLPSATVRIFRVLCTGQDDCFGPTRTAPELLAQTVSDGSGNFQAVVNANAPSD
ncbi:MAG TPA: carboxypeptidase-like regulatory domain-containing protein, partial [Polyangia bacterium]|nr:carboxypeptidase-like regulatory domain-containing protein [Polyangia bacterium]